MAGCSTWCVAKAAGSNGIRWHSFVGELRSFAGAGRLQLPSFSQQLFFAAESIKNCGHEIHPPQSKVTIMRHESSEWKTDSSTVLLARYQFG
jgi:hypothetical protein